MKHKFIVLAVTLVILFVGFTPYVVIAQIDQKKTPEQQIEEALGALPESMRDDVRVEGFDEAGNPVTLRGRHEPISLATPTTRTCGHGR